MVGPSGCGKTTVLQNDRRARRGQRQATMRIGDEVVNDVPPQGPRRRHGLSELRVVSEDEGGPEHRFRTADEEDCQKRRSIERVRAAASVLGHHRLARTASQASSPGDSVSAWPWDGRSSASQSVFLMDEPLSNLDAKLRVQMRGEMARVQQRIGVATLYVTHDQTEAMTLGHRVAVLRSGVLQQCRRAAGSLRSSDEHVRRWLHRLTGHEFAGRDASRTTSTSADASGPRSGCSSERGRH